MGPHAAFAETFWPLFTAGATVIVALGASAHVVLYKRDSRAAVAWVGLIWLVPILGSVLYVLFGINRVRRRVSGRRGHESAHVGSLQPFYCGEEQVAALLPEGHDYLIEMVRLGRAITGLDLLKGNTVEPLIDGDGTYPAMLDAIERAERSVSLIVYIFDNDAVGRRFLDALSRAVGRGVEVRVLIDAVGARYSMPPITGELTARGVRTARFMSGVPTWRTPYLNLRNHRKVCVIDGVTAFTGGMNIRVGHVLADRPTHPTRDIHFRVTGPVVRQLQATFVEDWHFTTGELLSGELWFPPPPVPAGTGAVCARAVPDGPDHHMDRMSMAFQGALAVARDSVRILTPYFLPERALIAALNICALRGVTVDIVVPRRSNLRMVSWAAMAQMWQILEWGCRVWLTPPPFDHSKLMVVDGTLSLIGSSNWDPRSLRLNFELGVECYDVELARRLDAVIEERIASAERLTREDVEGRPLPVKLRDGVVRLAAPYL
ncbi:MAG: phospholipase D-like domain-containing protein [Spirochaetaceae bacterium]